jgi:hypothetical protein
VATNPLSRARIRRHATRTDSLCASHALYSPASHVHTRTQCPQVYTHFTHTCTHAHVLMYERAHSHTHTHSTHTHTHTHSLTHSTHTHTHTGTTMAAIKALNPGKTGVCTADMQIHLSTARTYDTCIFHPPQDHASHHTLSVTDCRLTLVCFSCGRCNAFAVRRCASAVAAQCGWRRRSWPSVPDVLCARLVHGDSISCGHATNVHSSKHDGRP